MLTLLKEYIANAADLMRCYAHLSHVHSPLGSDKMQMKFGGDIVLQELYTSCCIWYVYCGLGTDWVYPYTKGLYFIRTGALDFIRTGAMISQCQRCNPEEYGWKDQMKPKEIDGLTQDCSNSIANALELLQSCPKPLNWWWNQNNKP